MKNRGPKSAKGADPGPPSPDKDKATKEEYNIARWMRNNVPVKKTKFLSHTVEYFTGCKAVDKLLESPWSEAPKQGEDALFTTRESVVNYLNVMLRHKLFHRARKIVVPENELKSKKKKDKEEKAKLKSDEKKSIKAKEEEVAAADSVAEGEKTDKESKKDEGEKKKKKVRLDMHLEQRFVDGIDAYVWIYEPTPYYYYFFGLLVVIAVIAICLFPLWPSSVRQGVYYLSLAAAGFLVFILGLAVLRLVFCLVWGLTFGSRHLWLLPNLTEDVGFLASFWPLYKYEYKGSSNDSEKIESVKGKDDSDDNATSAIQSQSDDKGESSSKNDGSHSETESEGSQKSQTGKDFELVEREELES